MSNILIDLQGQVEDLEDELSQAHSRIRLLQQLISIGIALALAGAILGCNDEAAKKYLDAGQPVRAVQEY